MRINRELLANSFTRAWRIYNLEPSDFPLELKAICDLLDHYIENIENNNGYSVDNIEEEIIQENENLFIPQRIYQVNQILDEIQNNLGDLKITIASDYDLSTLQECLHLIKQFSQKQTTQP